MRKREPTRIKFIFGWKVRLIAFLLIGIFLYFKLQKYEKVQLGFDHLEMVPAIKPGQTVYLYCHDQTSLYQSGDVIYFRLQQDPEFHFARIVAKDQGHLELKNKNLFINGNLHKPTENAFPDNLEESHQLKQGEFFIVQDKQSVSWMDSTTLGPLKEEQIVIKGKIFFYMDQTPSPN